MFNSLFFGLVVFTNIISFTLLLDFVLLWVIIISLLIDSYLPKLILFLSKKEDGYVDDFIVNIFLFSFCVFFIYKIIYFIYIVI